MVRALDRVIIIITSIARVQNPPQWANASVVAEECLKLRANVTAMT